LGKKVLITGICGFVGSTLAKSWLSAETGLEICGIDNLIRPGSEMNRIELQQSGIKLFHGDIRFASDFESLPPVDWVIDTAANPSVLAGIDGQTSSRQLVEHNLFGTVNILEYCKRSNAGFILLSSSRVYSLSPLSEVKVEPRGEAFRLMPGQNLPIGLTDAGVSEAFSTASPVSLYGSTKLASEALSLEYGETFGFPVWINRCGVLAGAGQFGRPDQGIFAFWINSWLRRKPLTFIGFGGNGHQVRDVMHPRDLVPLLLKQTAHGTPGPVRIVNLGGGAGNAMSLAELSSWCRERCGEHIIGSNPEIRRFDIPWLIMDSTVAGEIWGWRPETTLEDILDEIAVHAGKNPDWLELSGVI
jgi:CDP-paratose 2-epimerase